MSINNRNHAKNDFFDDDFEIIYEEDLPSIFSDNADDDYRDALSSLSELDDYEKEYCSEDDAYGNSDRIQTASNQKRSSSRKASDNSENSDSQKRKKKGRGLPNLVSPAAKTAKAGGKAIYKAVNFLLRIATLVLIAVIIYTLGTAFWNNHSVYGNIFRAVSEENYILGAYAGVALFLLLFEIITFLIVLFSGKKGVRKGEAADTGRGLFSFIFIFAGSVLAGLFGGLVPASPAPLQGVQGALAVYGSLQSVLFPICAAGVISCLIRKFIIR